MRLVALLMLLFVGASARGQRSEPIDSTISRARIMARSLDSAGARGLLDSLASHAASPQLRGEAMYELSLFAASPADRERILGALVVDHPFSPRVPEALLQLGMLELARNDRDRAVVHLGRYLSASVPSDSGRIQAALVLGRLHLERGELPRGCAVLMVGRTELPDAAIELRNQFEFSIGRCQGVDTTRKVDSRPATDSVPAPRRSGAYTVQVAAYETKVAAERLATTLRGRGLEARVVGTTKPFRVRVGRYATRDEAEEASREVDRAAKTQSIVVVVGPEER